MIISYGTREKHETSIKRLSRSCKALNAECYLKVIDDDFFSEERFKYLYKPTFILNSLLEFRRPVIWMDADSILVDRPRIEHYDFSFGYVRSPEGSKKWLADSCHIHTLGNVKFLKVWIEFCEKEKGHSDHRQLINTFEHMKDRVASIDVSEWFKGCYIRNYGKRDEIYY